jgi:hypothetical protein
MSENTTNQISLLEFEGIKEEDKISITEVVEKCTQFLSNEITLEELQEWAKKIKIVSYLPILKKLNILSQIFLFEEFLESQMTPLKVIQIETIKFWKILLAYTNIKTNEKDMQTFENYDICFPLLYEWILAYCSIDYSNFVNMLEKGVNIENVANLSEIMGNIDADVLTKNTKELKKVMKEIQNNKETYNTMVELMKFNDPLTTKVVEGIKEEALKVTMDNE